MSKFIVSSLTMAVLLSCSPNLSFAEQVNALPSTSTNTLSSSQNKNWRESLIAKIAQHPTLVAQRQAMESKYSQANALRQALYNPELASSVEKEGDYTNYSIGINQTFDWRDKSGVRAKAANFQMKSALQFYRAELQSTTAQTLRALVQYASSEKRSELALAQEQGINILIAQMKERQAVGELGPLDSQLALYSLGQKYSDTAKVVAEFEQVKMTAQQFLPSLVDQEINIPNSFWQRVPKTFSSDIVNSHPLVLARYASWQIANQNARLAALDAKADPTFGVSAGKSGGESTLGLNLSIPLNIRNDYSNEVKAANQSALAIESELKALLQAQKYKLKAAMNTAREYQKRLDNWQQLMVGERATSDVLMEKLWRSGEINPNDYLLSLQQISAGKLAGIDMQEAYQLALIDTLEQSGQLIDFISPLAKKFRTQ
jgi:outer membrane protein TolC